MRAVEAVGGFLFFCCTTKATEAAVEVLEKASVVHLMGFFGGKTSII
jgi:hypothetical protein